MKYNILLFDLDNTLLDFDANEKESLEKLFKEKGFTLTEDIFKSFCIVNKGLWNRYEDGEIDIDEVLTTRFSLTMEKFGVKVSGDQWEKMYKENLKNGAQMMDGAKEVCEKLSKTHRLFVATNGVREIQLSRLEKAGLLSCFENIFDSQSMGHQKPTKEFFDYIKNNVKDFDIAKTLMIGDSLSSDIKGGNQAGIDTCWLTKYPQNENFDVKSKYIISDLRELINIVY